MVITYYPRGSKVIRLSVGTETSEGVVTKVMVKMVAREQLLPTSTEYLQNSGLLPEVVSRAGLQETVTFSTYTETSAEVLNGEYVYRLELGVAMQ